MRSFAWAPARSVAEAIDLLARHGEGAHVMAGGTALVLLMKQGLVEPSAVIGLGGVDEMRGIAEADGELVIGGAVRLRAIETSTIVRRVAPVLAEAVGRVATIRIRNQATLGGNLAHADPAQDPPPVLLALDAKIDLAGPGGTRTLPLDELFVDVFETAIKPGEILTAIRVPLPPRGTRLAYTKFLPRSVDDYATVSVAARLDLAADGTIADARVALGAVGPVPVRARAVEAALRGRRPDGPTLDAAAELVDEAIDPIDDVRASAAYRREMARVWTARTLRQLAAGTEVAT